MIPVANRLPLAWVERHASLLLRLLVVAGVLVGSAVLALKPSMLYLMAVAGGAGVLLFMRLPVLGLALLIYASLFVRFALGTGSQTELHGAVLIEVLLLGLWVLEMVGRREVRPLPSRPIRPLFALLAVTTLALLVGNQSWVLFAPIAPMRAQLGGYGIFLLAAGAFLLVAHRVQSLRALQALTWLFIVLGGGYVWVRILPRRVGLHLSMPDGGEGSLFWTWLLALSLSMALYHKGLHRAVRVALLGVALATLYVPWVMMRGWVSGWLPALAAGLVVLFVGMPRLRGPLLAAGVVVLLLKVQALWGHIMVGENEYSLATRMDAWIILADIVRANPILGLGPANYYWYTPLFPIRGYAVNFSSHNNYVDLVAQTGLLGLGCFLWFMGEVGALAWRLRARVPEGFARAYLFGAMGGLGGMLMAAMLGDWVLPFVYNVGLRGFRASVLGWLFLGGVLVLERLAAEGAWLAEEGPRAP